MKKLLSLLLALSLVLSLAPMALADDEDVNETDYFDDLWHDPDVDLQNYTPPVVDEEANAAALAAFYALVEDESAAMSDVEAAFESVIKMYEDAATNYQYYYYLYSADINDEEAYGLYAAYGTLLNEYWDQVLLAAKEVLNSPFAAYLEEQLTQDDIDFLKDYEPKTQEEFDLDDELLGVEGEYYEAMNGDPTVEYEGVTWTSADIAAAYQSGEIDDETYDALVNLYYDAYYSSLAAVYAHLQDVCSRIAEHYGYDSYADYAYEEVFVRDYTQEEMQAYCAAVKEYIAPLVPYLEAFLGMVRFADDDSYYNVYRGDFTTEETLDAIEPYIGKISSEMLEAWQYMREHNLIDNAYSETKSGASFTSSLTSSRAPYMIISPVMYINDFTTVIHEFGHYNDNYWHEHDWNSAESNTDVAEVHSQANELLFTQFYDDFFGDYEYGVEIATNSLMENTIVWGLIMGAMVGELELYIHSDAKPTLDEITAKFADLAVEYQVDEILDGDTEWWMQIPHIVSQPLYYISYSVSAVGAFEFWLDAQENGYDKAYGDYLKFVSLDPILTFKEQFEEMNMSSPFDPDFLKELGEELNEKLGLEVKGEEYLLIQKRKEIYTDVTYNHPERGIDYDEIWTAIDAGLMVGFEDGTFRPAQTITRAETVYLLWEMAEKAQSETASTFTDVQDTWYTDAVAWAQENGVAAGVENSDGTFSFLGTNELTRVEAAVFVYRFATLLGLDTAVEGELTAADAASVSSWGADAVNWCVENGILSLDEDGNFAPAATVTRSKMAVIVSALSQLLPETDAAE